MISYLGSKIGIRSYRPYRPCRLCSWSFYKNNTLLWKTILVLTLLTYFAYTILFSFDMENKRYLYREGLQNRENIIAYAKKMHSKHIRRPLRQKIDNIRQTFHYHMRRLQNI